MLAECREKFPRLAFDLKIIKSTGDKLQIRPSRRRRRLATRALFTKELETALLKRRADMAVHSLKDLPTQLPDGLKLGAVAGKTRGRSRRSDLSRCISSPKQNWPIFRRA